MNIDQMAHEFVMNCIKNPTVSLSGKDIVKITSDAWVYADFMKAESDKRKPKGLPEVLFEPDWSQAPKSAKFWAMDHNRMAHWFNLEPCLDKCGEWLLENNGEGANNRYSAAPLFNYQVDWKKSLRKRP